MGQKNIDAIIAKELNTLLTVLVFILFAVAIIITFVPWKELFHFV